MAFFRMVHLEENSGSNRSFSGRWGNEGEKNARSASRIPAAAFALKNRLQSSLNWLVVNQPRLRALALSGAIAKMASHAASNSPLDTSIFIRLTLNKSRFSALLMNSSRLAGLPATNKAMRHACRSSVLPASPTPRRSDSTALKLYATYSNL